MTLGQEFAAWAASLADELAALRAVERVLCEVNMGGTAIGTGLNAPRGYARRCAAHLARISRKPIHLAANLVEATQDTQSYVLYSSVLTSLAIKLSKVCNDLRLLSSGPRAGLREINLPAMQPGSSIMPGKVNPVICESAIMVCCQVIGNDAAITYGGFGGVGSLLDLNVAMPMMAANLLDSIHLLARACDVFTKNLLEGLTPDEERCAELIERCLAMCTSLVPVIGYDKSAALAKEAFKQGKTVRQLAYATVVGQKDNAGKAITREDIDSYLTPWSMTLPGGEGSAGG